MADPSGTSDLLMPDATPTQPHLNGAIPASPSSAPLSAISPAIAHPAQNGSSTPSRSTQASAPVAPPDKPMPHGSNTRRYLNVNVTPHLLEAMKALAAQEPAKPLQWLSEFLAQRSREVEP